MADVSASAALGEAVAQVLLVGGALAVGGFLFCALSLWYVVRRVRRSRRIRRGMDRGRLTVASVSGDGVTRRLARLHLRLLRSTEATERALGAAQLGGRPLGDLPMIAARLTRTGDDLDHQLRLAEADPDPGVRQAWASWLEDQVAEHTRLSAGLRRSLLVTGLAPTEHQLTRVGDHLAIEVEAMTAWDTTYRRRPV